MKSVFLQEQAKYSKQDFCELLMCTEALAFPLLHRLTITGIIKPVSTLDINDSDYERPDKWQVYVCIFVGIAIVGNYVFKCYPKYLPAKTEPITELRQILKVLGQYNGKYHLLNLYQESRIDAGNNKLSLLLFLLNDYLENDLYSRNEIIQGQTNNGEILWDRTIYNNLCILSEGKPYYSALVMRRKRKDDSNVIRKIHEYVITSVSRQLQDADLLEILGFTEIRLTDGNLDDLGGKDLALSFLDSELSSLFNTRKRKLLESMIAFLKDETGLYSDDNITIYGTSSFYHVWETVCSDVIGNKLNIPLSFLSLPCPLRSEYMPNDTLLNLIERPFWSATGLRATESLIPDIVSMQGTTFLILDAKYYAPELIQGQPAKRQPGIESVIKQYFYQIAFSQFIKDHGFKQVYNCFLFPSVEKETTSKGKVEIHTLNKMNLQSIHVWLLPAAHIYDLYLKGQNLAIENLIMSGNKVPTD